MIGFITTDFTSLPDGRIMPGGCGYYRCALPMAVSAQRGHMGRVAFDPVKGFGVRDSDTTALYGFRTIVLKLIMDRWTTWQVNVAKSIGQRIIVDVDDHYAGLPESNKAFEITHPEKNKRTNRAYYEDVIAAADTVTVSTPFLLEHHSKFHPDVRMVRNGILPNQFPPRKVLNRKPILGWAGAVDFRGGDLETLRSWLPDFLEEHDLMFHHAGHMPSSPSFADVAGIDPDRLMTSPLVPMDRYAAGMMFDIGIVPLNMIPFNEAKSNIKGLEYAASGIPFVAAPTGEYKALAADGVGRVAGSDTEWVENVTDLLDYSVRKRESALSRKKVLSDWSIGARAREWQSVFAKPQ